MIFFIFTVFLVANAKECNFDECASCTLVNANPTYYPELADVVCGSIAQCCNSDFPIELKKFVGHIGELKNKKLDDDMKTILDQKLAKISTQARAVAEERATLVEISEDGTSKLLPNYIKYKSTSSNLEDKVTYIFSKNADYDHPDGKTKHDIESIKQIQELNEGGL